MLSSISWAEFFTYLTIGIALYYSVWLFRYYPTLRMRRPDQVSSGPDSARHDESKKVLPGTDNTGKEEVHREPDQAKHAGLDKKAEVPQEKPLRLPPPVEAGKEIGPSIKVMEMPLEGVAPPGEREEPRFHAALVAREAMEEIEMLLSRAIRENTAEPEWVYEIQQLLDSEPYRRLRHTEFYARINESIRGTLEKTGSIPFDAERIKGLWVR
jgi:hypothetical protein